jgi:predicted RNase H-like HicB family nuclease
MKFLIAIEPGSDTEAFGVAVPALPGCFSAGDTLEEAFDNAVEAIEAFCEVLAEDGKDLPMPLPMAQLQAAHAEDFKGWTWAVVEVPIERLFGPAEKINITVPGRVLAKIDDYAKGRGMSRSGFLVAAAQEAMAHGA